MHRNVNTLICNTYVCLCVCVRWDVLLKASTYKMVIHNLHSCTSALWYMYEMNANGNRCMSKILTKRNKSLFLLELAHIGRCVRSLAITFLGR